MTDHVAGLKRSSPAPSAFTRMIQWFQLKKYQFEVTISLYMLTPAERVVFYLLSFTLISMFLAAAYFYLPNHVSIISNRVYYYIMGELNYMGATVGGSAGGFSNLVRKTSGKPVAAAAETIINAAAKHAQEL